MGAAPAADQLRWLVIVSTVAVLLAAAIACTITRSIIKPLNEAVAVANQLSEGDLTANIVIKSRDETGQCLNAMKNMVEKLAAVIGEVAGSSVELAELAGRLLDEIVPAINKTSDLVQEIAAASKEQSSGTSQVNAAVSQLNQVTQQNASVSEELAATSEEMSGQAEQLQQTVAFFKVENAAPANIHRHGAAPRRKQVASEELAFVRF